MRNIFLLSLLLFFSKSALSQDRTIVSDLENLTLDIGQLYKPVSDIIFSDGSKGDCSRIIYYQKKGVLSSGKSITFDRAAGTLKANEPGTHEVIAVCIDSNGKRLTRAFNVFVNYPKVKEVKLSVDEDNIYEGNYVPLS